MTQSKSQREREWRARKNAKNPHGKVKSFEKLADEGMKNDRK